MNGSDRAGGAEQRDVDRAQGAGLARQRLGVDGDEPHAARGGRGGRSSGYSSSPRSTLPGTMRVVTAQTSVPRGAEQGRGRGRPSSSSVAMTTSACRATRATRRVSPKRTVLSTLPPRCAMPLTSLALTSQPSAMAVSARIGRGQQDALAADADQRDGRGAVHEAPSRRRARPAWLRAPRRQTSTQRPQPVHASVIRTASSPGASAGQPMSRHRPQRLQRSSSTTTRRASRAP